MNSRAGGGMVGVLGVLGVFEVGGVVGVVGLVVASCITPWQPLHVDVYMCVCLRASIPHAPFFNIHATRKLL